MIAHHGTEVIGAAAPGDIKLLSVTSIINVAGSGESDPLVWGARRGVAELAIDRQAQWRPHVDAGDRKAAVDFLAKAHAGQWDQSRDTGSAVHDLLERWLLDDRRPGPVEMAQAAERWGVPEMALPPYLDQFDRWLDRAQPAYEAAELVVFNRTYGYAGTADAILTIDGVRFLADYKTTARAHDSQGRPTRPYADKCSLQLNAYSHAEHAAAFRARRVEAPFSPRYYALSAQELAQAVPVPAVDAGLIIHLTPEHCTGYPFTLDEAGFRAFLHAIEVYRWVKHRAADVMGAPLDLGGVPRGDHRPATPAA